MDRFREYLAIIQTLPRFSTTVQRIIDELASLAGLEYRSENDYFGYDMKRVFARDYRGDRLIFLDGLRGWAALVVLIGHTMGTLANTTPEFKHPIFNFITNGHLSVYVFFVLSGFALTNKFVESPGRYSIALAVTSRYFRLAIPVFATSLIAYLLMKAHLFFNQEAAALAGSKDWLGIFFTFDPSLKSLFSFSLYRAFFDYGLQQNYNTNLWTMPIEFEGSMLVFSIVAIFLGDAKVTRSWRILMISLTTLGLFCVSPAIGSFGFGYLFAEAQRMRDFFTKNAKVNRLIGLLFFCPILTSTFVPVLNENHATGIIAAISVFSVTFSQPLNRIFSSKLSHFLGRISFPLYLVQMMVICSPFSYLLIRSSTSTLPHLTISILVFTLTLGIAIASAYLLLPLERFSVSASKRIGLSLLGQKAGDPDRLGNK